MIVAKNKISRMLLRVVVISFVMACFSSQSLAQFYTGSEVSFGRKRVQYEKFFWMYYQFDGFDVYFNRQGKNLAYYTANYVQHNLYKMEDLIGFKAEKGLKFIVFNRLTDYKQSNIGYLDETSETGYNTGGTTRFLGNKVFVYFNGDYVDFEKQIRLSLAELILSQAIIGTKTGSQYKNSYLMDLPKWFTAGLASYLCEPWNETLDEKMQQAVQQKRYRHISNLEGEEAVFAGHSFWYFVAQKYGEDAVKRCIRIVASERSMDKTFQIALNIKFKDLMKQWLEYYKSINEGLVYDSLEFTKVFKRTNKADRVYNKFVLNQYSEHDEAAFVYNYLGRAKVFVQSLNPTKRKCIYRIGASVNDKPDYTYPILAWHPNGRTLGIVTEEKGRCILILHDLEKKKRHARRYGLDAYEKITGLNFSSDGRDVVLSASNNGQSDIYIYNFGSGTSKQLTFDIYDDKSPIFIPNTNLIVFTSNRPDDTLRQGEKFEVAPSLNKGSNLFAYDLEETDNVLLRLTDEEAETYLSLPSYISTFANNDKESKPKRQPPSAITFLSNESGNTNISIGRFGRQVSNIDTAIHYRSTFKQKTITNYQGGLLEINIANDRGEYGRLLMENGRYVFSIEPLKELRPEMLLKNLKLEEKPLTYSKYKSEKEEEKSIKIRHRQYLDSLRTVLASDTSLQNPLDSLLNTNFIKLRNANINDIVEITEFDRQMMVRVNKQYIQKQVLSTDSLGALFKSDSLQFSFTESIKRNLIIILHNDTNIRKKLPPSFLQFAEQIVSDSIDVEYIDTSFLKYFYTQIQTAYLGGQHGFVQTRDSLLFLAEQLNIKLADTLFKREPPKQNIYKVRFTVSESKIQLGFNYLNSSYQVFANSESPLYLNSTANGFTQITLTDLMENHRIIGGFSFSFDFSSMEYLLSYENMERRLGHQFIFHMINHNQNKVAPPFKQRTFNAYYIMKYPITPILLAKGTVFARHDQTIYKSYDYISLIREPDIMTKVGLKGELIFDHARFITQNIYYGTRAKAWVEYYQGIINNKDNLFVVGVDFRDYRRLYKTLIWANRFAASTSFGMSKLVYYMGGVDGWMMAKFNRDVKVDQSQNYAYQTLATNMRGFIQNIRNGNTFAVINSEIRFPIAQVISPVPVKSSFLRHLQLILFCDVGSAWSGWNPWDKDNNFYKQTIEDGKLTIVLDKDANPFVLGFGTGLRAQILGYFIRADIAWGVENGIVRNRPVFYLSFSTDF